MTLTDTPTFALQAHDYRPDFPILQRKVASGASLAYLDNAASTQRPQVVLDAMDRCYREYYANVHRGIHTFSELSTEAFERARQTVAQFLNTESLREVVFTAGTTAGINTVARSWGDTNIRAGDRILLSIAEHHANIVPWHQLAERTGAEVHFMPLAEDGTLDLDEAEQMLDRLRPKLLGISSVSNVLGTIFPVEQLIAAARRIGAVVLVDAAQAAPHQPLDFQALDADFLVFSGHKVCGPTGIGVLAAKEQHLRSMPAFLGGGGMIHRVTTEGFEPAEPPEKFEAGTPPIAEAIGLAAALDYISNVGMDRIDAYERQLARRAHQGLAEIPGLKMLGPSPEAKTGIVSFVFDKIHAHDVAQALDGSGVAVRAGHHCAMPLHHALGITATSRASFYFYNTPEEIDTFVEAVDEARVRFAPRGRKRASRR